MLINTKESEAPTASHPLYERNNREQKNLLYCLHRQSVAPEPFHQNAHRPPWPPLPRSPHAAPAAPKRKTLPSEEAKQSFLPADPLLRGPVSAPVPRGPVPGYASPPLHPRTRARGRAYDTWLAMPSGAGQRGWVSGAGRTVGMWAGRVPDAGGVAQAQRGWGLRSAWPRLLRRRGAGRDVGRGLRGLGRDGRGLGGGALRTLAVTGGLVPEAGGVRARLG